MHGEINVEKGEMFLEEEELASKYDEASWVEVMSIRGYVFNSQQLLDRLDKLNSYGIDRNTDESMLQTSTCMVDKRFMIDLVKSIVVDHVNDTVAAFNDEDKIRKIREKKGKGEYEEKSL
jgi:hypothetical protein